MGHLTFADLSGPKSRRGKRGGKASGLWMSAALGEQQHRRPKILAESLPCGNWTKDLCNLAACVLRRLSRISQNPLRPFRVNAPKRAGCSTTASECSGQAVPRGQCLRAHPHPGADPREGDRGGQGHPGQIGFESPNLAGASFAERLCGDAPSFEPPQIRCLQTRTEAGVGSQYHGRKLASGHTCTSTIAGNTYTPKWYPRISENVCVVIELNPMPLPGPLSIDLDGPDMKVAR